MLVMNPPKYAHADKSHTYHLMGSRTKTLCGLSVLPVLLTIDLDLPLHLVKNLPVSYSLCKHCIRVQKQLQHSRN